MFHWITMFDDKYLPQGLVMIESLRRYLDVYKDTLSVFAMSEDCYQELRLRGIVAWPWHDLLTIDSVKVGDMKSRLTRNEFFWSMEPAICDFKLRSMRDGELLVYVDSDCLWFDNPVPYLESFPETACVGLTPHWFPAGEEHRAEKVGRFNFGCAVFRACDKSRKLVADWLAQTLKCCDGSRAGHQPYLDAWPELLGDRFVELPRTWNVGPWQHASIAGNPPLIEGQRLTMFHFHEMRRGTGRNPVTLNGEQWNRTQYDIPASTLESVYLKYEQALEQHL